MQKPTKQIGEADREWLEGFLDTPIIPRQTQISDVVIHLAYKVARLQKVLLVITWTHTIALIILFGAIFILN